MEERRGRFVLTEIKPISVRASGFTLSLEGGKVKVGERTIEIPSPTIPPTFSGEEEIARRKCGVVKKGQEIPLYWTEEFQGLTISYRATFKALEEIVQTQNTKRWEGWTFMPTSHYYGRPGWRKEEDLQTEATDGDWHINLPIPLEKIGTKEEYDFLVANKVFFADEDGDSTMSSSYIGRWESRIAALAKCLNLPDPTIEWERAREKERERLESQLFEIQAIYNRQGMEKIPFLVKEKEIFLSVLGQEIPTGILGEIPWRELRKLNLEFSMRNKVALITIQGNNLEFHFRKKSEEEPNPLR